MKGQSRHNRIHGTNSHVMLAVVEVLLLRDFTILFCAMSASFVFLKCCFIPLVRLTFGAVVRVDCIF